MIMGLAMALAQYSVREQINDGRLVSIRSPRPDDRAGSLVAIEADAQLADHVDDHVVLIAELDQDDTSVIVGTGQYVVIGHQKVRLALAVEDGFRGRGIGTQLARHLVGLASAARIRELVADVSPNNMAMRKILAKFGFRKARGSDPKLLHFVLPIL